jgi:hydrogenase maturation factor HypF (carbamoyltransferase family)
MPEVMTDGGATLSLVVNVRTWLQHTTELHLEAMTSDNYIYTENYYRSTRNIFDFFLTEGRQIKVTKDDSVIMRIN